MPAGRSILGLSADRPPSAPARAAAVLVGVEAVGVAVYTIEFLFGVLPLGDPWQQHLAFVAGVLVFLTGSTVVLGAAALALLRVRHWPRSLLLVAQVMFVAIGVPVGQGGDIRGWFVVAVAVATGLLLLHPAVGEADRADRPTG